MLKLDIKGVFGKIGVGGALLGLLVLSSLSLLAQNNTRVKGTIIDAETKEPLPFVNVAFVGKNIGTTTDFNGKYNLSSKWASGTLTASFMGYETQEKAVVMGDNQTVNFELQSKSVKLEEVTVVAKGRYRNKENPAVTLIKKVIANKDKNRIEGFDYYSYDKYEKLQLDLNNITEDFMNRKAFKKFGFMWNYVDTSKINGKPYLPLYLTEKKSHVYYRANPKGTKEIQYGMKTVGFEDFMDEQGIEYFMEKIYQDIDIYDNSILLMEKQFKSPISNIATATYKYFILDTIDIDGLPTIQLAFQPRNSADLAFRGEMFIALDSSYAVKKIKMGITRSANINFVSDLEIEQDFIHTEKQGWLLSKDQLTIDYNFLSQKMGMYGKKTVSYKDIKVNVPPPDSIINWSSSFVSLDAAEEQGEEFWEKERHEELNKNEAGVYEMTKDLKELPAFKRAMNVLFLLISGYYDIGKFDIGPLYSLFSFNDVEGIRNRLSIRTNKKFSKKVALVGYVAYGWRDEKIERRVKGGLAFTYFFKQRPYHQIDVEYQRDIKAPGASVQLATFDNVFVSFRRGVADLMLYHDTWRLKYTKEWNGFGVGVNLEHIRNVTAGKLKFSPANGSSQVGNVVANEVTAWLRYFPNTQYYEGRAKRVPILNKNPIISLSYTYNIGGGFLGSKYDHHKINASIFKRFFVNPIGFGDMNLSGGYLFGQVPFPLMFIHKGNQTFFFDPGAFNMMNLFEFVSDKYVALEYQHHFNGFFFNKIPFLKKLKWRMTVGFKGVYGGVSKKNDPRITQDSDRVFEFPSRTLYEDNGYEVSQTVTHTLDKIPYMEASIGIENIFKFISIDLVKRFTHLDNPNVSTLGNLKGLGLRTRFAVRF